MEIIIITFDRLAVFSHTVSNRKVKEHNSSHQLRINNESKIIK